MALRVQNGRIRTNSLEIRAAEHCNLRCRGCSQNSPFVPASFPPLEAMRGWLARLAEVLRPQRVKVLGGEPTLNPELEPLLEAIRASGIARTVALSTNGLLLPQASDGLWDLVDAIEISVYPANLRRMKAVLPALMDKALAKGREIKLVSMGRFTVINVTTPVPEALVGPVYAACYYKHYCHTLHRGHVFKCAPCVNAAPYLGEGGEAVFENAVRIADNPDLFEQLCAYFDDAAPLPACRYCLGTSGRAFQHRQLRRPERAALVEPFSPGLLDEAFARAHAPASAAEGPCG